MVKFELNKLSYYNFRQRLRTKCMEYGCRLIIVTENYTLKIFDKYELINYEEVGNLNATIVI